MRMIENDRNPQKVPQAYFVGMPQIHFHHWE